MAPKGAFLLSDSPMARSWEGTKDILHRSDVCSVGSVLSVLYPL